VSAIATVAARPAPSTMRTTPRPAAARARPNAPSSSGLPAGSHRGTALATVGGRAAGDSVRVTSSGDAAGAPTETGSRGATWGAVAELAAGGKASRSSQVAQAIAPRTTETTTTNVNTPARSVSPGLGWPGPPPAAPGVAWWVLAAVPFVLFVLLAVGAAFVRLPYYALAPGSARNIAPLVHVAEGHSHPPRGSILLTTVSVRHVANIYEAVDGWIDPTIDVVPERDLLGNGSRREYQEQAVQAMSDSKQIAEYVAFSKLGYEVAVAGEGALVLEVVAGMPVASLLKAGDVILEADGKPVRLASDLVAVIAAHRPGDTIALKVLAANATGTPREVGVALGQRDDGTPLLGVGLQTYRETLQLPFAVEIESGEIGGPSGGLAFTLALLDLLTPGELTGGVPIAATGTIEMDGQVGPVGGVAQKTVAVERAGAKLFLVPSAEYEIAKARAGDRLRVEKADTLDEALAVLATLDGSNALALGTPGGPN
jgi:Lon-like protease